ncbi:hypothetical protein BDF20DRAFT_845787 [Mycotypha africana]|uniref:uncharacterized protein n=1 Tax=Mycotypha africana TaxID=64632 RepID=UPI00230022DB|nr:uncharacterized protein BDF20DRAFT_845787 [Mycotypha africana]KAI8991676.1 hypothetical protein BDF20DRAFT_845787 [Mycotypha africana]
MGDLDHWMDEDYLRQLWHVFGENVAVKLIRDKRTNLSCGYAFIEFSSTQAAQRILDRVHNTRIPNTLKIFRLNWASGGGIYDRKEDRAPEYSLFVGDLCNEIDETYLLSLFRQRYPSCHSAKIMTDPTTGSSRGYGFVRFLDQAEQQGAVIEMNGVLCGNRPIRVSFATPKINHHQQQQQQQHYFQQNNSQHFENNNNNNQQHQQQRYLQLALQAPALINQVTDPNNTTVFVGGLSSPVTEEELGQFFAPFGDVIYVKIPPGKGCGFVQYASRISAEQAIERMNGFLIGNSRIRLSWGRSQNDKNTQQQQQQQQQQQPDHHLLSPSTNTTISTSTINTVFNHNYRSMSPPPITATTTNNSLGQRDNVMHNNNLLFLSATSPRQPPLLNNSTNLTDMTPLKTALNMNSLNFTDPNATVATAASTDDWLFRNHPFYNSNNNNNNNNNRNWPMINQDNSNELLYNYLT